MGRVVATESESVDAGHRDDRALVRTDARPGRWSHGKRVARSAVLNAALCSRIGSGRRPSLAVMNQPSSLSWHHAHHAPDSRALGGIGGAVGPIFLRRTSSASGSYTHRLITSRGRRTRLMSCTGLPRTITRSAHLPASMSRVGRENPSRALLIVAMRSTSAFECRRGTREHPRFVENGVKNSPPARMVGAKCDGGPRRRRRTP